MAVLPDVPDLLVVAHAIPRAMAHLHLRGVLVVLRAAQAVAQVHVVAAVPAPAVPAVQAAVQVPVDMDAAPAVPARVVVGVVQDAPLLAKVDVKGVVLHRAQENVAVPLAVGFVPMSVTVVSVMEVAKAHVRTLVKAPASTLAI